MGSSPCEIRIHHIHCVDTPPCEIRTACIYMACLTGRGACDGDRMGAGAGLHRSAEGCGERTPQGGVAATAILCLALSPGA
jgi:hypothetical protein